jgi:hypothetical protein
MSLNLANYACGLFLLGAVATSRGQTTWNYFISDAGGGNSLVTWSVNGSLATPPGAVWVTSASSITVSVNAPGIYADAYAANGGSQSIPTPDGSYFQYDNTSVYTPIVSYDAYNAPGSANDSFGLLSRINPRDIGTQFLYQPGTQAALIPINLSDFNPGTYQSEQSGFDTPLTVNLTVSAVPEPSALALFAVGGLLFILRRK